MITYVSIELGQFFGSLYGGCNFLKILSEIKNVQVQNRYNRESKLILKSYCVRPLTWLVQTADNSRLSSLIIQQVW